MQPSNNYHIVFDGDHYLQIDGETEGKISLHLIKYLSENQIKMYREQLLIGASSDIREMFVFQRNNQLMSFIKQQDNYEVNFPERKITFKLTFTGKHFSKLMNFTVALKEEEHLTEMQQLKWANKVLRKKLEQASLTSTNQNHKQLVRSLIKREQPFFIELIDHEPQQQKIQIEERLQKPKNTKQSKAKFQKKPKKKIVFQEKQKSQQSKQGEKFAEKTKMIQKFIKSDFMKKILQHQSITIQKQSTPKQTKTNVQMTETAKNDATVLLKERISQRKSIEQNQRTDSDKFTVKKIGNKYRFDFEGGDYYFGEIKDDTYNGQGFYYSTVFGTFDGEWKGGKANGQGVSIDRKGNKSIGFYKNGQRFGLGVDQFSNGDRYQGEFYQDLKHGRGKYTYSEGGSYQGEWKNNMADGQGVQYYKDGSFYKGFWKTDTKDGNGKLHRNGNVIKQTWQIGTLIYSDICRSEGLVKIQENIA